MSRAVPIAVVLGCGLLLGYCFWKDARRAAQRAALEQQAPADELEATPPVSTPSVVLAPLHDNALRGQVFDEAGRALRGVEVVLGPAQTEHNFFSAPRREEVPDRVARTDEYGAFEFLDLAPGHVYPVDFRHGGHARLETVTPRVGALGTTAMPLIVLHEGLSLTGVVRDPAGRAIPEVELVLDGMQFAWLPTPPPDRLMARSTSDGSYAFSHVALGPRLLTVRARGWGTQTISGLQFQRGAGALSCDIVLEPAERIRGRVVDRRGNPLDGARLLLIGFDSARHTSRSVTSSDARGEFLIEDLRPGMYNVLASARGYRFDKAMRARTNGDELVFEGLREADICGQVVDAETGEPVTDFTVRLRISYPGNPIAQPLPETSTPIKHANGEFCLVGVGQSGDGGYLVEVSAPGYAPALSEMVTVQTDRSIEGLTLRLGHGGSLRGRVVDGGGKPVPHAQVTTHDNTWTDDDFLREVGEHYPTNATTRTVHADADGQFDVSNLHPEVYQLVIEAPGFPPLEVADFRVELGQETNAGEVRLSSGGTLRGVLRGPDGRPVFLGALELFQPELSLLDRTGRMTRHARSDRDGAFELRGLRPGSHLLIGLRHSRDGAPQASDTQVVTIVDESTTTVVVRLPE